MITRLDQMNLDISKFWQKHHSFCHSLIMINHGSVEKGLNHTIVKETARLGWDPCFIEPWCPQEGGRKRYCSNSNLQVKKYTLALYLGKFSNTIIHQPDLLSHSWKLPPYKKLPCTNREVCCSPRPGGAAEISASKASPKNHWCFAMADDVVVNESDD